jgi:hypothetical protein
MDVLARDEDAPVARDVRPGDHFEQRSLAGAVRAEHSDDLRALKGAVDIEAEGGRAIDQASPIHLAHAFQRQ